MLPRFFICVLLLVPGVFAQQQYSGPRPEKKDVPYLVHADNLVETETGVAQQQDRKKETAYLVPGQNSPARTPLASPRFIIDVAKMVPERLQLFQMEPKNGHREITLSKKDRSGAQSLKLSVTPLEGTLFRLDVVNGLSNGEYCLTPDGANEVFCFAVY